MSHRTATPKPAGFARSLVRNSLGGGFSLVEIVVALGVVAFAVVAIMGLLPAAVDSAVLSKQESRATFIAKSIQAHLAATPFDAARIFEYVAPAPFTKTDVQLDLAVGGTLHLAYNSDGEPTTPVAPSAYIQGLRPPGTSEFLVRVTATPVTGTPGLCHIEIRVESPAAGPEAKRRAHTFVTLLADPNPNP